MSISNNTIEIENTLPHHIDFHPQAHAHFHLNIGPISLFPGPQLPTTATSADKETVAGRINSTAREKELAKDHLKPEKNQKTATRKMNFVSNIIWNSVEGFVEAGKRTAGGYAGDALIKAGDLIEGGGRKVGGSLERTASGYGSKISGKPNQPSGKAASSTASKPVAKRSNSTPAPSTSSKALGGSKTPIGGNKYPGGKAAGAAQKQITNGASGAQKAIGGVAGAGKGVTGGVVGGANKTLGGAINGGKGVTGGVVGGLGGAAGNARKGLPKANPQGPSKPANFGTGAAGALNGAKGNASLPKPYNPVGGSSYSNANSSSYNNPYPSDKKTAVKPGQSKPFKAPGVGGGDKGGTQEPKPYPGTNTLPGSGNRTPVNARKQRYKPAPRMSGAAEAGKMQHISV